MRLALGADRVIGQEEWNHFLKNVVFKPAPQAVDIERMFYVEPRPPVVAPVRTGKHSRWKFAPGNHIVELDRVISSKRNTVRRHLPCEKKLQAGTPGRVVIRRQVDIKVARQTQDGEKIRRSQFWFLV